MADRQMPHDLDAERSALGSIIIKPAAFDQLAAQLKPDDFFLPAHREIFEAMGTLAARKRAIDVVALGDELRIGGQLRRLDGGQVYLNDLANATPTAEHAVHYAGIVAEKAVLRRLIATCAEVQSTAYGDFGSYQDFLGEALGKFSRIVSRDNARSESLGDIFDKLTAHVEAAQLGQILARVPTGITRLDRLLGGGLGPGQLIVPCGLTSMGKSSWAVQVAFRGAEERKIPALIFSLEMTRRQMFIKGAANLQRVDTRLFNPPMPGERADWDTIWKAGCRAAALADLVRIEEHRTIEQIVAVATAWRASISGLCIVIVDHIQKAQGVRSKTGNRQEEVWSVAHRLKDLAKDLEIPVVAPAQLDNDAAKEKRPPKIGDIRDSKAIEHEADVVLGIHRERMPKRETDGTVSYDSLCELLALKNRDGRIGKVTCDWRGAWQGFENRDTEHRGDDEAE